MELTNGSQLYLLKNAKEEISCTEAKTQQSSARKTRSECGYMEIEFTKSDLTELIIIITMLSSGSEC